MGLFKRIFGGRKVTEESIDNGPSLEKSEKTNLAFVLLSKPHLPNAKTIVKAFREFADSGEKLIPLDEPSGQKAGEKAIILDFNSGERSFVALVPFAVPDGEAEHGVQFSLSGLKKNFQLQPHHAHLIVSYYAEADSPPLVQLSRFTSLLASVIKVSPAVGVYWANAGATHEAAFFTSIAKASGISPRMMVWSGVSIAHEPDGRLSLLSLGMHQLDLPDLLLVAGKRSEGDALPTLYDLLTYVAGRGKALPEGDTVGRSQKQRLPVRYVPSPIDPNVQVWRVELP